MRCAKIHISIRVHVVLIIIGLLFYRYLSWLTKKYGLYSLFWIWGNPCHLYKIVICRTILFLIIHKQSRWISENHSSLKGKLKPYYFATWRFWTPKKWFPRIECLGKLKGYCKVFEDGYVYRFYTSLKKLSSPEDFTELEVENVNYSHFCV